MATNILPVPRCFASALCLALLASCGPPKASSQAGRPQPEPRGYGQLVYHPPSRQLILLGGESNQRTAFEDSWVYHTLTDRWSELRLADHPVNAEGRTAAYDAESDQIIVHFTTRLDPAATGGLARMSETWALDVANGRWTNMRPDPAPFGLMGARMVYDAAADRMILFGGADFTQSGAPRFNETWSYDFNTNTWSERHPDHPPPGRSYFGMAYDARADKTLIFGGSFAAQDQDRAAELWAYDYSTNSWESLPYRGAVRSDHHPAMAFAAALNRTFYVVDQAAWSFDYPTRTWTALAYDSAMGVRHFHALAFDEEARRLVLFGGGPMGLRYDNATWRFDPASTRWQSGLP